ncbi:MAG: PIG-L family deacetylase [Armatimonadota bacterium]|nr:PIG-L family deacetylase [Armatimonadota bacterium]
MIARAVRSRPSAPMGDFPEPGPSDRFLITAAHADDELLAAGGLMQRARAAGADVWVVFATNGDAGRWGVLRRARRLRPRPIDYIAGGEARQREAFRALGRVGVTPDRIVFLGYPDRGLMALAAARPGRRQPYVSPFTKARASPYALCYRPGAPYTSEDLQRDLETIVAAVRPTVVVTHHPADRHRDHRALFALTRLAIQRAAHGASPPVYAYLVHAWTFPRPLRYAPGRPLLPPRARRARHRWLRFALTPEELAVKQAAMREYRSQLDSPYLRVLLSSFLRQNELFAAIDP